MNLDQLTATVHVVTIGTRELTLTKYRQLDTYEYTTTPYNFQPFGRVNANSNHITPNGQPAKAVFEVLGKNCTTGALTKVLLTQDDVDDMLDHSVYRQVFKDYQALPLIILGGMR